MVDEKAEGGGGASKKPEGTDADPFDTLLSGGGETLSLDSAVDMSNQLANTMEAPGGAAASMAAAAQMASQITQPSSEAVEPTGPILEPASEPTAAPSPQAATAATAASQVEGGEVAEPSAAQAKLQKVNQYVQSNKSKLGAVALVLFGIRSPDPLTRRASVIFILSFVGAVYVASQGWINYSKRSKEEHIRLMAERASAAEELAKKLAEEERYKNSIVSIGRFTLELNPVPGARSSGRGIVNMAEVEIVLRCDSPETRDFVEHHQTQLRSALVSVLVAMDREELLSHDGKKKWKAILLKAINQWMEKGHVEDLYFSKLVVS